MPTAKGKYGSMSHRYRPASEYDDATLAQKREYWRTKKREQRARLSERRGKPTHESRGKKHLCPNAPALVNSGLSGPFTAFSSPLSSNYELDKTANNSPASQSRNSGGGSSVEDTECQKERWLETMNLNKVLSQLSPSSSPCSVSAKAAGGNTAKCLTRSAASKAVTSPTPSRTHLNASSSVPQVRVTKIINGSSAKKTPQPCVSMQAATQNHFKTQHMAHVAFSIQPKHLPTNVNTCRLLASSPCATISIKQEGKAANTRTQSGTKSALVTSQRAKGVSNSQPFLESEEERAAKRREHWRIKKREQRAKMAARLAKARERTQGTEVMLQRHTAQKTGLVGGSIFQRHCPPRVKTSYTSAKRENNELQIESASSALVNLRAAQTKGKKGKSTTTQTPIAGELLRKLPGCINISNVSRGIVRCKTPRQKFIEAQKNLMNQRNTRRKRPFLSSLFGTRNIPQIDPTDTPEQIIAKRREYWRIKKREQRAKLSLEVKVRLKEKDSLMRRVKRYQKILEEMRRARALTQSAGGALAHASETIGGFIKEDGTVTVSVPQVSTCHNSAAHKSKKELHAVSNNDPISKPHQQPDAKHRSIAPFHGNQLPPPLCPSQVKVSLPLSGQFASKSPRLLSIRPRTQLERTAVPYSHSVAIQTVGQLTLTHPQTTQNGWSTAGSNNSGCVMKMAVSNSVPAALSLDPELTEEERMAKKREYWRIKKREQRAARAARLKQGLLQARVSAALQRRKALKQVEETIAPPGRRLTSHAQNAQPLAKNSVPIGPHSSEIKQDNKPAPTVDLNSQSEQAICPDIKPPTSPVSPPAPQQEPDPALNADSQATTLLAVASMKKLLEESLSTVTECKNEQSDVKMESVEEASQPEVKPNLTSLFFEKDEVVPIGADLMLEIKSWETDTDVLLPAGAASPHLKDISQNDVTLPPLPSSSEAELHPLYEHSSSAPSDFVAKHVDASVGPSSPHRAQRLCSKKAGHQTCCFPEPPKLHHLPMDQQCEQQCQAPEQCQNNSSSSAQRFCRVVTEHGGLTSLQRKREYWKLMKRQQRARLKARQTERRSEGSSRFSQKTPQAVGLLIVNTTKGVNSPAKPATQPNPSVTSLTAVTSIPPTLVVSPARCTAEQSSDTLQSKLPLTSVSCAPKTEQIETNVGPLPSESIFVGTTENQLEEAMPGPQTWTSAGTDSAPCLPTLKPPENPLSSFNLQPIEHCGHTPDHTISPIKIPCAQFQSPTHMTETPTKMAPISTMIPPKPIPGESEEDFLRRKREYWRIKKKEQRARKAIRDKGITSRRASTHWRPILPAQDMPTQDSGQWVSSSEESVPLISTTQGSLPYSSYRAAVEDEPELLFVDYENTDGDEGPVSDAVWRNRYLMDYDPLNQLLVCMVCGELQYSQSVDGVRAHIDEAHPDTLAMDAGEKQRILEAWDEQVSQRERFFTSQLQQHSGALTEAHNRDGIN